MKQQQQQQQSQQQQQQKKKRHKRPRHQAEAAVSAPAPQPKPAEPSKPVKQLPGFYYDEEKRKYFKIDPTRRFVASATMPARSQATIAAEKAEQIELSRTKRSIQRGKFALWGAETGVFGMMNAQRQGLPSAATPARTMKLVAQGLVRSRCNTVRQVDSQIQSGIDAQRFCVVPGSRAPLLFGAHGRRLVHDELHVSLTNSNEISSIAVKNRHWQIGFPSEVSSIHHMRLPSSASLVLVSTLGGESAGELYAVRSPLLNTAAQSDHIETLQKLYSFKRKSVWTCCSSRDGQTVAVGASKAGFLLDSTRFVPIAKFYDEEYSDIFSMEFSSQNSSLLYCGMRTGNVCVLDVRVPPAAQSQQQRQQTQSRGQSRSSRMAKKELGPSLQKLPSSVISLNLLHHTGDTQLVASTIGGDLQLRDIRMTQQKEPTACVLRYEGHVNSEISRDVPVLLSRDEKTVVASGSDGIVRLWDTTLGGRPYHTLGPLSATHKQPTCMQWLPVGRGSNATDFLDSVLLIGGEKPRQAAATSSTSSSCSLAFVDLFAE